MASVIAVWGFRQHRLPDKACHPAGYRLFVVALPIPVEDYTVSAADKALVVGTAPAVDRELVVDRVLAADIVAVAAVEVPTEPAFALRNYRRTYRSDPDWLRN